MLARKRLTLVFEIGEEHKRVRSADVQVTAYVLDLCFTVAISISQVDLLEKRVHYLFLI